MSPAAGESRAGGRPRATIASSYRMRTLFRLLRAGFHTSLLFLLPWLTGALTGMAFDVREVSETSGQFASVFAMVIVAVARVSPVSILRGFGTVYVTVFRNTPLLILIIIAYYGMPDIGINPGFFPLITIAMGIYTSTFIAEALRSSVAGKWEGHQINTARFVRPERLMHSIGG